MKKKEEISKNNKKIWEEFVKNPTNLYDKDANKRYDENQKRYRYDLHGFSLEEANIKVKHHDHATVSNLPSKKFWKLSKDSYKLIKEYKKKIKK